MWAYFTLYTVRVCVCLQSLYNNARLAGWCLCTCFICSPRGNRNLPKASSFFICLVSSYDSYTGTIIILQSLSFVDSVCQRARWYYYYYYCMKRIKPATVHCLRIHKKLKWPQKMHWLHYVFSHRSDFEITKNQENFHKSKSIKLMKQNDNFSIKALRFKTFGGKRAHCECVQKLRMSLWLPVQLVLDSTKQYPDIKDRQPY